MPKSKNRSKSDYRPANNIEWIGKLRLDNELSPREIREIKKACLTNDLLFQLIRMFDFEGIKVIVEKVKVDLNLCKTCDSQSMLTVIVNQDANKNPKYLELFKYFVEHGANVNYINKYNSTVFFYAAKYNQTAILEYLIAGKTSKDQAIAAKFNFDINLQDINKRTALMVAAANGYRNIVDLLLKMEHIDIHCLDKNGYNALMLCALTFEKDKKNDYLYIANSFIKKGINLFLKDNFGRTIFMIFAYLGQVPMLQVIASEYRKKNPSNPEKAIKELLNIRENRHQVDVFHLAAFGGDIDCAKYLLKLGADINSTYVSKETYKDCTALMGTAFNTEHYKMVEFLINGFEYHDSTLNKNIRIAGGNIHSVNTGKSNLLTILFDKAKEHDRKLELKKLAQVLHLIRLISKKMEDLNAFQKRVHFKSGDYEFTALAFAVQFGNVDLINDLINRGARVDVMLNRETSLLRFALYLKTKKRIFPHLLRCHLQNIFENEIKNLLSLDRFVSIEQNKPDQNQSTQIQHNKDQRNQNKYSDKTIRDSIGILTQFLCSKNIFDTLRIQANNKIHLFKKDKDITVLEHYNLYLIICDISNRLEKMKDQANDKHTSDLLCDLELNNLVTTLTQQPVSTKNCENFDSASNSPLEVKYQHEIQQNNIDQDQKTLIEDLSTNAKTSKTKTKGISNNEKIQKKIAEFQSSDPENQIFSRVAVTGTTLAKADKAKQLFDCVLKENNELQENEPTVDVPLKTDDDLKLLVPQKKSLTKSKNRKSAKIKTISIKEDSKTDSEDEFLFNFDRKSHFDKESHDFLSDLSENGRKTIQADIDTNSKVLDKLQEVERILTFDPNRIKELSKKVSKEHHEFLITSALCGGFGLLMEELKKFKGPQAASVFSPILARFLRNFIFHEEGELPEAKTENLIKMCYKLIKYLKAFRNVGPQTTKNIDLNTVLCKVKSKLFNVIIALATKKAEQSPQPSFEICVQQIKHAKSDMTIYKTICQMHPELLEDHQSKTVVLMGLGRAVARLSSYVSAMREYYHHEYLQYDYAQYVQYIEPGNCYRHGENEGDRAWGPWFESLAQELLLGFITFPAVSSLSLPPSGTSLQMGTQAQPENKVETNVYNGNIQNTKELSNSYLPAFNSNQLPNKENHTLPHKDSQNNYYMSQRI